MKERGRKAQLAAPQKPDQKCFFTLQQTLPLASGLTLIAREVDEVRQLDEVLPVMVGLQRELLLLVVDRESLHRAQ